jgi:hypothetical protein
VALALSSALSHLGAIRDDHLSWELPRAGHVSTPDLSSLFLKAAVYGLVLPLHSAAAYQVGWVLCRWDTQPSQSTTL